MNTEVTLGEIADVVMGQSPTGKTCNKHGDGMPLLNGPTEFGLKHPFPDQYTTDPRKRAKKDDLLFCVRGSAGRMNWADQPYAIGRGIAAICGRNGYPNSFIKAAIEFKLNSLLLQATGSTFPNISRDLLKGLRLPFVSMNNAKKIASILEPLDNYISLLQETNATLEAIAQALFKSWFVDFDPVRAKAEGRQPEGIDAETAALFPDRFEESELGIIPSGWTIKSLGAISEILNGYAFKSTDYVSEEGGCFVLRTKNFSKNGYVKRLSDDVFLPGIFTQSHRQYICEPFDFHLVMVGASIGKTSIVLPHTLPALRNQNMWCFRPQKGFPSKFFIHEIVKTKICAALSWSGGSAREFFRKGDFEKNRIICPNNPLLSAYENIVESFKNKISVNENLSDQLSKIRDSLLPKLISGDIRIHDAEKLMKMAT